MYFKYKYLKCILNTNKKVYDTMTGLQSSLIDVVSGVQQCTLLGTLVFLLHINDLSSVVSSSVSLFNLQKY